LFFEGLQKIPCKQWLPWPKEIIKKSTFEINSPEAQGPKPRYSE
jgi:hypothetical protein